MLSSDSVPNGGTRIAISMDGLGRCKDNLFVERLWKAIKHRYLYQHSFSTCSKLCQGLEEWIRHYNHEQAVFTLDDRTPDEVYCELPHTFAEAV